jgi:hypothetical protein
MTGPPGDCVRHRLLEGALLRLARLPDADAFVLRGGMLMRHWFRPVPRPAADLDLVATFPFDVAETRRRLAPLLADGGVGDGVAFDPERFRVEAIWQETAFPGVRVYATGEADGAADDFHVDVTFGEPLEPAPVAAEYPMQECPLTARLHVCRPETIVGRKLHAIHHMGMLHWRAKDLNDVRLLLGRVPLDPAALPGAIVASFASRGDPPGAARGLFARPWWNLKRSVARWQAFARDRGPDVPPDLAGVVAEVAGRLGPVLGHLP